MVDRFDDNCLGLKMNVVKRILQSNLKIKTKSEFSKFDLYGLMNSTYSEIYVSRSFLTPG